MPFRSQAQRKFLYAKHPSIAKEFASKTSSIKALPKHAKKAGQIAALKRKLKK